MKRLLATALFLALPLSIPAFAAQRDRDDHHDNGKHKGHDRDDDRHDNGKHKGWDNPHNPHYGDSERFRPGHPYPYGRYGHVKHVYVARRFDVRTRRIVLFDQSNWVVAAYDVPQCRDWEWDRDQVYVYDDDHHAGWYVLFNARLGRTVHVEFAGVH
jgi:Ni/Co efflux regulator RcnB